MRFHATIALLSLAASSSEDEGSSMLQLQVRPLPEALTKDKVSTGIKQIIRNGGECMKGDFKTLKAMGSGAHTIRASVTMPSVMPTADARQWILNLGQIGSGANHWLWSPTNVHKHGDLQFGRWNGGQIKGVSKGVTHDQMMKAASLTTTFDGKTYSFYIDGKLKNTTVISPPLDIKTNNLRVGLRGKQPQGKQKKNRTEVDFSGCVTKVEVWDSALTSDEVAGIGEGDHDVVVPPTAAPTAAPTAEPTAEPTPDAQIYGGTQMTVNGCRCQSECKTDKEFGCHVAEVCLVEEDCLPRYNPIQQHPTKKGLYDWCAYPAFEEYEQLSAQQKYTLLLSKAYDDTDINSPTDYPDTAADSRQVLNKSVWLNMDANSDISPFKRKKMIHSVGVVGGVKFTSSRDHPYQGIFQGAQYGIIRLSAGAPPSETAFQMATAVKFLRDGRRSANILADRRAGLKAANVSGFALCGENEFQDAEWSNHLEFGTPEPVPASLQAPAVTTKFFQVSNCPAMLGLSDAASNVDGTLGPTPWEVIYKRADRTKCDCTNYGACLANWANKSVGAKMFDVEAVATPGATAQHIGEIFLTSKMTRSKWGDEELLFQHQSKEDDLVVHPDWLTQEEYFAGCLGDATTSPKTGIYNNGIQPKKGEGCIPMTKIPVFALKGPPPPEGLLPMCDALKAEMLGTDPEICP